MKCQNWAIASIARQVIGVDVDVLRDVVACGTWVLASDRKLNR